MKLPAAARQLKLSFTTVKVLARNGDLQFDPETDTSRARFVTRASVRACWIARNEAKRRKARPVASVPFAEVVRFTGRRFRGAAVRSTEDKLDCQHAPASNDCTSSHNLERVPDVNGARFDRPLDEQLAPAGEEEGA
jgi:hypothetical protein